MKSMFNLANLFTALNLIGGIFSILLAVSGHIEIAPIPLFVAMIFDFLDGFVARLLKVNGPLGKQLDSLADMVSFGVAPGVMLLVFIAEKMLDNPLSFQDWMKQMVQMETGVLWPLIGLLFPFLALFRLAKFNIDERQTDSFIGVPTPAATLFFCSFPLSYYWEDAWGIHDFFSVQLFSVLIVVMSFMMIAPVPLLALKFKSFGIKENAFRYLFLLISLLFIPFFRVWSLALIVLLYLIISIIQNTIFKNKQHEIQSGN